MNLDITMSAPPAPAQTGSPRMLQIAKRQRLEDALFHRVTQTFSLLVLLALLGIIVSLLVNAWPTFQKFGLRFVWYVEWDIINEEFGAAIAIVGTLISAGIALLLAVPLAFGVALFLTETCPAWLRRPLGTAVELLAARRDSLHDAHHEVMGCLGEMLWESQRNGRPPDGHAYLERVRARATRD